MAKDTKSKLGKGFKAPKKGLKAKSKLSNKSMPRIGKK